MQEYAQTLDSSRAFTVALSGGWDSGSGKTAQVMGYNYIVQGDIDGHHKKFPWQPGIGTEESNTIGTRGIYIDNREKGHMAATNRMPENVGTESGWQFYEARPFLAGLFYWTGFDYRGEPNPLAWPAVNSQFGIVDLCGFPKDIFYYLKSVWTDEPVLHIMPHWNLTRNEGENVKVTTYCNASEVELILNNTSLGKKAMPRNGHIDWDVRYEPGILLARGYTNGELIITRQVETTGDPASILLNADRTVLNANGSDVTVITVQILDGKKQLVPTSDNEVFFSLSGPGKIIGVGNGDPASHEPEQFIESVEQLPITDLQLKLSDPVIDADYLDKETNEFGWIPAFENEYGEYEPGKNIVIRGTFQLDSIGKEIVFTLFARSLAADQDLFVNGHLLGKGLARNDPNQVFVLDHSILNKGKNTVVYTGKPLVKQQQWEVISTDPGTVKVYNPAPQWKRKTFNGLAQVIIRTTKEAGEISLSANSGYLTPASLQLLSKEAIKK
jgi:beta-galactosidase